MKVTLEGREALASLPAEQLERLVEEDLQAFDTWFQKKQMETAGQGEKPEPLVRGERAILKTYLYWKTKGATDA